jgi:hypothetical protein
MSEYEARKEPQEQKAYREEEPRGRSEEAQFEETGEVAYYIPRD